MADITRRLGLRHLRGAPTAHVRHHRLGRLAHDGPGLGFRHRPTATLSEVPVDDRELAMTFHARTSDFQDVAVQATVTYRIVDPGVAATRLDFSIDPDTGSWRGAPLEQLGSLLTETAQQHALDVLARTTLAAALVDGVASVRERIAGGLGARTPAARDGDRGGGRTGRRAAPGTRGGAGAAHSSPRADPAGGGQGDVRTPGRRRRTGAGDRRERARQPDRTRPARGAVGRPARHQRAARGAEEHAAADAVRAGRRRRGPCGSRRRRAAGWYSSPRPRPRPRGGRRGAGRGAGRLAAGPRRCWTSPRCTP